MTSAPDLPYRPCVGLMLFNAKGEVFVGKRIDQTVEGWQMPQGGIDKGEEPRQAALRELEEETGYRAGRMENLGEYFSSPGMVSESFTLLSAHDLTRVGPGGGTEGENITVHAVPLASLPAFIAERRARGDAIDVKLLLLLAPSLLGDTLNTGSQQ